MERIFCILTRQIAQEIGPNRLSRRFPSYFCLFFGTPRSLIRDPWPCTRWWLLLPPLKAFSTTWQQMARSSIVRWWRAYHRTTISVVKKKSFHTWSKLVFEELETYNLIKVFNVVTSSPVGGAALIKTKNYFKEPGKVTNKKIDNHLDALWIFTTLAIGSLPPYVSNQDAYKLNKKGNCSLSLNFKFNQELV